MALALLLPPRMRLLSLTLCLLLVASASEAQPRVVSAHWQRTPQQGATSLAGPLTAFMLTAHAAAGLGIYTMSLGIGDCFSCSDAVRDQQFRDFRLALGGTIASVSIAVFTLAMTLARAHRRRAARRAVILDDSLAFRW